MALLVKGIRLPTGVNHGISDPRANKRTRLRFSGQVVQVRNCTHDHSQIFPEFVQMLGGELNNTREYKVIVLLSQIPGIHRTFCNVTGEKPNFLPIKGFLLLQENNEIWAILKLSKTNKDVKAILPFIRKVNSFRNIFIQVKPSDPKISDETWFQTDVVNGKKRGVDKALTMTFRNYLGIARSALQNDMLISHLLQ